jgi:NarL family two-component system response regulator LiaR
MTSHEHEHERETISVLLVDDHPLVREGVSAFLQSQPDIEIVGTADSGEEAVRLAERLVPDVVLMDLVMPGIGGVEATQRVRTVSPRTYVVVLTSFHDDSHIFPAVRAGALSYLLKDAGPEEIAAAVRAAARGEATIHPRIATRLMRHVRGDDSGASPFTELTEREQEVLRLIAQGDSNADIAAALSISEKTVKAHVSNLLSKLYLADRTQAAVLAWREGFVRRPDDPA